MKKKIAIVTESMIMGGVEKSLIELLNVFDYDKYEVTLFLKNREGSLLTSINPNVVVNVWKNEKIHDYVKEQCLDLNIPGLLMWFGDFLKLRRYKNSYALGIWYSCKCLPKLDSQKYDCAIAYHDGRLDVVASTLYRIHADKRVLWVHSKHLWDDLVLEHNNREFAKFDKIFCVSNAIRWDLMKQFPKTTLKTEVIHNIVNKDLVISKAQEYKIKKEKKIHIVTIGRLEREKGHMFISHIAKYLIDKGIEFIWYIIGDGSLKDVIENELINQNVKGYVKLVGEKENPYPYISACDIYVQPSLIEGWGIAVQEAKILCKPIVVTPIDALMEQIKNRENGLVSSNVSPEAIGEKIVEFLKNVDLKNNVIENLKQEVHSCTNEIEKLFEFIDN